jgi:hypothetical protein
MALFHVTDSVNEAFDIVYRNFLHLRDEDRRDNLPPNV